MYYYWLVIKDIDRFNFMLLYLKLITNDVHVVNFRVRIVNIIFVIFSSRKGKCQLGRSQSCLKITGFSTREQESRPFSRRGIHYISGGNYVLKLKVFAPCVHSDIKKFCRRTFD